MIGVTFAMAMATTALSSPVVPSDEQIRKIISDRIDIRADSLGIVIGVIDPSGQRIIAYGRYGRDDARPVDGDTIFEIGSVTKTFTALLLADMVAKGEASLADPVAKYLPSHAAPLERADKAITLRDLATQTSGLPRLPDNLTPASLENPYADYTKEHFYAFLSKHRLTRDIGVEYEYSNLGFGLLGHALALNADVRDADASYETLVRNRITTPLGMDSTGITLSPDRKARLAGAHDEKLQPVSHWDMPVFVGAGALRSSALDMLAFLAVPLGYKQMPLTQAFTTMSATRFPLDAETDVALGWMIDKSMGDEVVWHNGGTGGHRAFVGYRLKTGVGIVVLSNAGGAMGVDDIGLHLLNADFPLAKPAAERKTIEVAADRLDAYVGRYQLAPDFVLTITREENRLFAQATGQSKAEIYPESETEFFLKVVEARIVFVPGPDGGQASRLILLQGGQAMPAERLGD